MTRLRRFAGPLALWLLVLTAVGWVLWRGQEGERDALVDRFQNRANTGADFISAYVDDVFDSEQRLADRVSAPGWRPAGFAEDSEFLGFPAAVLLDQDGRVAAVAPSSPDLLGTELGPKYAHLSAALDGQRTVSDVVPSAVEGEPIVAFALPMAGSEFGVVSGAFSLTASPLATFLERQPISGTRGVLFDSKGEVIVSAGGETAPAERWLAQLRESGGEPIVTRSRVLAAAPVSGTGWTYVLDAPRATLLAPATANNGGTWLLLGVIGVVSLAGLGFLQHAREASARARQAQLEREVLLSGVVDTSPNAFVVTDTAGAVEWWNRAATDLFGWTDGEAIGRPLAELIVPEEMRAAHREGLRRRAAGGAPRLGREPVQLPAVHRDGHRLQVEMSLGELQWEGERRFHAFLYDITEREAARQELLNSEERFRTSFSDAPIGQLLTSLADADFGRLIAANPAAQRMLGYSETELQSLSFQDITHPDDAAQDAEMVPRLVSGELDTIAYEKRYVRKDGSIVWVALSSSVIRETDGTPVHSIAQLVDITERKAQAEQLAELHRELEQRALYDPLTGLANRGLFMDRLMKALLTREAAGVAVGFCDLDHFKGINDTHGHQIGDAVLQEVATRLEAAVRGNDTVARLGGDEFVLLLTGLESPTEARAVLERAGAAVKEPIVLGDITIRTSLSGGLATAPGVGADADTLLRDADLALYVAKDKGRGRIEEASTAPTVDG